MDNMHMVNVLILDRGAAFVFDTLGISSQLPGVCVERRQKQDKLISSSAGGRWRKPRGVDGG